MQSILHSVIGPAGPEQADLTGKVAVVTGTYGGLAVSLPHPRLTCNLRWRPWYRIRDRPGFCSRGLSCHHDQQKGGTR